ncbi:MAG: APC family permease, partial [Planctomycetota bacterium]
MPLSPCKPGGWSGVVLGEDSLGMHGHERGGSLRRELGLTGAVATGLGSILGAGVFVSLGVAAGVAGSWVLVAIVLAGGLAVCNALSSAQLAADHPVSGGTYEYGYRYLGPSWGFAAGWMFLCAKSASAATAALGCAAYVLPWLGVGEAWGRWSAVGLCVLMTLVVMGGVRRSTWMNLAIVGVAMASLLAFVAVALGSTFVGGGEVRAAEVTADVAGSDDGVRGLLYATALVFVAYTGYGRIATLGEEVREPRKTIPRAIVVTLVVSGGLYLLVGVAAMAAVGAERFAAASDEASGGL